MPRKSTPNAWSDDPESRTRGSSGKKSYPDFGNRNLQSPPENSSFFQNPARLKHFQIQTTASKQPPIKSKLKKRPEPNNLHKYRLPEMKIPKNPDLTKIPHQSPSLPPFLTSTPHSLNLALNRPNLN